MAISALITKIDGAVSRDANRRITSPENSIISAAVTVGSGIRNRPPGPRDTVVLRDEKGLLCSGLVEWNAAAARDIRDVNRAIGWRDPYLSVPPRAIIVRRHRGKTLST